VLCPVKNADAGKKQMSAASGALARFSERLRIHARLHSDSEDDDDDDDDDDE